MKKPSGGARRSKEIGYQWLRPRPLMFAAVMSLGIVVVTAWLVSWQAPSPTRARDDTKIVSSMPEPYAMWHARAPKRWRAEVTEDTAAQRLAWARYSNKYVPVDHLVYGVSESGYDESLFQWANSEQWHITERRIRVGPIDLMKSKSFLSAKVIEHRATYNPAIAGGINLTNASRLQAGPGLSSVLPVTPIFPGFYLAWFAITA